MRKSASGALAAGVFWIASQGAVSGETLWELYQPACAAQGIDEEPCLCIMGKVAETHGEDAARYLGLDMTLRYDDASILLEKIGEDTAFAAGNTFDAAQNLSCSASQIARLKGTYQDGGSGEASAGAMASDATTDETLIDVIREPLQVLTSPHPVLDFSAIQGDVTFAVSLVIQSELVQASAGGDLRNYLGFYEVADTAGTIDLDGDGKGDVGPTDPAYATTVQSRTQSPKLYFDAMTSGAQMLGEVRLEGSKMYAPVLRFKHARGQSPVDPSAMTSMEDLMNAMSRPRHVYYSFPGAGREILDRLETVSKDKFALYAADVDADPTASSRDALIVINLLR